MFKYPVNLNQKDGFFFVSSPDFPEVSAFGETEYEALSRALGAFEEAIAARLALDRLIPPPSEFLDGQKLVSIQDVGCHTKV